MLLNGSYLTTVPYEISGPEYVKKVELIYRTGSHEQYFMPYYRFYVELPEEEMENGRKSSPCNGNTTRALVYNNRRDVPI